MIEEVLQIWNRKLKLPSKDQFAIERINDTNLFLTKDFEGKIGIIIENTLELPKNFSLKRFEFKYFKKLENKPKDAIHERCQLMLADKSVEPSFLIKILFGILECEDKRNITSRDLMEVITSLISTFDPEAQKRNEVIGVWGELFWLKEILSQPIRKEKKAKILRSWESDKIRMKIDMRFAYCKIAVEIKTTTTEERVHHISGLEQFLVPSGFKHLLFLSIRIIEDDAGMTCSELTNMIKSYLDDPELLTIFLDKIFIRGAKICNDIFYRFTPRDNNPLVFFDSKIFPLPSKLKGVTNLQWDQNFDLIKPILNKRLSKILSAL